MIETKERVLIRWIIRRDLPAVLAIEEASFAGGWTEDDFPRCLRQRNCIGMVAERGDDILGYMIFERHEDGLHLLNLAVDPGCRRRGIGSQMVARLIDKLASHNRSRLMLVVHEGNLGAQLFFRQMGFRATRVLRDWYRDGSGDDAYEMEYAP